MMHYVLFNHADVNLELSGSVRAGFALKESDTNIRIVAPRDSNFLEIFTELYRVLETMGKVYLLVQVVCLDDILLML